MPVILKLSEPAAPESACAYKVTDTKCVTEARTYEFASVFDATSSVNDALDRACSVLGTQEEHIFVLLGTGELNAAAALLDALSRREPAFASPETRLCVVDLHGDELVDALHADSRPRVMQDEDAVFRLRGAGYKPAAQARRALDAPARNARIWQACAGACTACVVELPYVPDTQRLVQSLAALVARIRASADCVDCTKTYFAYRDSAITKLLWADLCCAPRRLNVVLFCALDSPHLHELLQLGETFSLVMAGAPDGRRGALRHPAEVGSGDLKQELLALAELERRVRQLRADANAAEYARRQRLREKHAQQQQRQQRLSALRLRAELLDLEGERRRKAAMLAGRKRQLAARAAAARQGASRLSAPQKMLTAVHAELEATQQELRASRAALAAALALTPAERNWGNIRQAEFNLRTLRSCAAGAARAGLSS